MYQRFLSILLLLLSIKTLAEPAVLSPRSNLKNIYVRDYTIVQDDIKFTPCIGEKGNVKSSDYIILKTPDACLQVSAKDQYDYLVKVMAVLARQKKTDGIKIQIPNASWVQFATFAPQIKQEQIPVQFTRGGQFRIELKGSPYDDNLKTSLESSGITYGKIITFEK